MPFNPVQFLSATLLLFAFLAGPGVAQPSQKQQYEQAMTLAETDPQTMIRTLEDLAADGYARAMDRLAYFRFKGIASKQNTEAAIALYQGAVAAGRTKSLVSLGKLYLAVAQPEKALGAWSTASQHGIIKADALSAWAHASKKLGAGADPDQGFSQLRSMAEADVKDAQYLLLDALTKNRQASANVDAVIDRLLERAWTDDAKAAEALLRYYRVRGHATGSTETRHALLHVAGVRDKVRVEEALYLSGNNPDRAVWALSEEIVQTAPPSLFARALEVSSKVNKNAFVRILQKELTALGYRTGRPSPYMNRPLIRATNQFCRDHDIARSCVLGPLKSTTIKAVAGKLAELRQGA